MMYRTIAQELEYAGLSECNHPRDYLNFYCLGQREPGEMGESLLASNPSENSAVVCSLFLFNSYSKIEMDSELVSSSFSNQVNFFNISIHT